MTDDIFADEASTDSATSAVPSELAACPLLGLLGDSGTHASFATEMHRCFSGHETGVELSHQSAYCLSDRFEECPRYHEPPPVEETVAGEPKHRHVPLPGLKLSAMVLSIGTAVIAVALMIGRGSADKPPASPTAPAAAVASVTPISANQAVVLGEISTPTVTPTARATATKAPTATATQAPVPAAASNPAPTATAGPIVHVVAYGESLTSIAAQYSISFLQIMYANNMQSTVIHPGQSLVIPPADSPSATLYEESSPVPTSTIAAPTSTPEPPATATPVPSPTATPIPTSTPVPGATPTAIVPWLQTPSPN